MIVVKCPFWETQRNLNILQQVLLRHPANSLPIPPYQVRFKPRFSRDDLFRCMRCYCPNLEPDYNLVHRRGEESCYFLLTRAVSLEILSIRIHAFPSLLNSPINPIHNLHRPNNPTRSSTMFTVQHATVIPYIATSGPAATTAVTKLGKRGREDDEEITRSVRPRSDSPVDPLQVKLQIGSNLAELAEVSSWTPKEVSQGRRLLRMTRHQCGPTTVLKLKSITQRDADANMDNTFNLLRLPFSDPRSSDVECVFTSVDFIRCVQLIASPIDRLSISDKNRVRRQCDPFKPITLSKYDARLMKLKELPCAGSPITIDKSVKIFKWEKFEHALKKVVGNFVSGFLCLSFSGRRFC